MNLRLFKRIVNQVLIFPVLALVLIAAILIWQLRTPEHTFTRVEASEETIAQTNYVGRLIIDQETGVRGYAATSDSRFLDPYTNAVAALPDAFANLEAHPLDKPEKQKLTQLESDYQTWLDSFARPVVAMTEGRGGDVSNADARDIDLNLTGKRLMDQVRSDLQGLTDASEVHRLRRTTRLQTQTRNLVERLAITCLIIGVFIGLFSRSRLRAVSTAYQNSLNALRKKSEEIFLSEQRLRTTLASIGDGVITCNAEGKILMMNQVACDLTGWTADEALDHPLPIVFRILAEESREPVEDPVAKVMRLKKIVGLANHTILIRKDGQELNIDDSGAPIRDQNNDIIGVVLVFRDVTLEKRTQQALIASEKLAVAGRLAASIAHEIHNPLDSVSNILYLMKAGSSPQENEQFLTMAQQELARVTQISRSMLSLYRESVAPVAVDIKEILEGTVLLLDHRIHELGTTVDLAVPGQLSVEGFPAELRQVFTNLVVNAIEAAGADGKIEIDARHLQAGTLIGERHPDGVLIEILDNGPGIQETALSKLFEPFFSTKGEQGTGLGLWVSRGIIRKHGGVIELNNRATTTGAVARVFLASHPVISPGAD